MKKLFSAPSSFAPRLAAAAGASSLLAALAGCGAGTAVSLNGTAPLVQPVVMLKGSVHGGNQPVVGARIQLFVAGATAPNGTVTGYGTGATPVTFTTPVVTDVNGNYTITGNYTCPTPTQQAYIIATGGDPGTGYNANLAEMAALGPCPAGGNLLASTPVVAISEVTTVAAVWALQQFMAPPSLATYQQPNIGAPNTSYAANGTSYQSAVLGMNNAFITAKVMADISNGLSPNANYPYATPETAKINTIADILAYCVNSASTPSVPATTPVTYTPSTPCSNLFAAVTPSGQTPAADTIQAAYYMAQNPINNISTLYNFVAGAGAPFQPTYLAPGTQNSTGTGIATNSFNDTTIAINYAPVVGSASTVAAPYAVAIDAFGNAWLSNAGGVGGTVASVAALGVDGSTLVAPTSAFTVSSTGGAIPQFSTAPTTTARTFNAPKGVAIDLNNRAWVANSADSVTGGSTTSTATPPVTSAVTAGSLATLSGASAAGVNGTTFTPTAGGYFVGSIPFGVAVDGANNVFVTNTASASSSVLDGRSLAKLAAADGSGFTVSTTGATTTQNSLGGGPTLLAIDANTNPIIYTPATQGCKVQGQFNASTYFGLVGEFLDSTDAPLPSSAILSNYSGQAVGPGASGGNCGTTSSYVGQLVAAAIANPTGVAIDRSNSVWLSDLFTSSLGFDGLTYLATPNPSSGAVSSSTFLVNGALPTASTAGVGGTTINKAGAVFVDGNNNVWVSNQSKASVAEASLVNGNIVLDTPGQGTNLGTGAAYGVGFQHNLGNSTGLAIDASGNVWVTNQSTSGTYTNQAGNTAAVVGNSMTVIVGAAGPVVTPTSLAIKANRLGQKP